MPNPLFKDLLSIHGFIRVIDRQWTLLVIYAKILDG